MVRGNVVKIADLLDDFRAFILLFTLYIFFDYILPIPTFFLGSMHPAYAYLWLIMWLVLAGVLALREVNRRNKVMTFNKWHNNPNAVDEYLALMKEKS